MNEPSVLDYLKFKLGMAENIEIPADDISASKEEKPSTPKISKLKISKPETPKVEKPKIDVSEPESPETSTSSLKGPKYSLFNLQTLNLQPTQGFPLRAILAILLAIIGQTFFEPEIKLDDTVIMHRSTIAGFIFYFSAFSMLFFAYLRKEWRLPTLTQKEVHKDNLNFKILGFLTAIPFAFAAFFTFTGNSFNLLNIFPWILSFLLFLYTFWYPTKSKTFPEEMAQDESPLQDKKSKLIWGLLLLALLSIVLFFRFYQTATVPAEPFSDHAEKILDVYDITQGITRIFFPRNTGREAFQMYWTLLVSKIFQTGLSFYSLKLGTALLGFFTLPYIYLLGKEIANKRVGAIAFFLMGISYWHNIISRVGLRFPLYPLFVAPVLFYLLRGIRKQNRNDFILAGIFLGIGAHGYSPFRIMPIVVLVAVGLYLLHKESKGSRKQTLVHLYILILFSLIVFLPLGRYMLENPDAFFGRTATRLGEIGEGSFQIFLSNFWDGLLMFNYDNGRIWVHAVRGRPALDVVSAALFLIGLVLLIARYIRKRDWRDFFLVLAILLLQLPSTLSLAFPEENPALNRAGGAAVIVFVVAALAFDGLVSSLNSGSSRRWGAVSAWVTTALLLILSGSQNYNLVFNQYAETYKIASWNSSEMGKVILEFEAENGQTDTVWIVPTRHWVDTRLPGVWAGIPNRDFALWQHDLEKSLAYNAPKLFLVRPIDEGTLDILAGLYPNGVLSLYTSAVENHDFMLFNVP